MTIEENKMPRNFVAKNDFNRAAVHDDKKRRSKLKRGQKYKGNDDA